MGNVYKLKEEEIIINDNERIVLVYKYEDYYDWIKVYYDCGNKRKFIGELHKSSTLYREYLEYDDEQIILVRVPLGEKTKYIKALYDMVNKEFKIEYKDNLLPRYDEVFKSKSRQ